VISHGLWVRKFGRDPKVVGRTMTLDGSPGYTIHGVMPEGFNFPSHSDLFRSSGIAANPRYYQDRAMRDRFVLVRLRPGIGVAAAGPLTVLSGRGCVTLRAWSRTSTSI